MVASSATMGIQLPRLPVILSIVGAVLRPDAYASLVDFSDPAQFTEQFAVTYIQAGSPTGTVSVSSETLVHNANGGSTATWVYDSDPHNRASIHPLGDFTLSINFALNTGNASVGIYFGGHNRTNSALALVNLSNAKPIEQLRLMTGASLISANAGAARHASPPATTAYAPNKLYRLTLNVSYVADDAAQVTLTLSDPHALGTPLPPVVLSATLDRLSPMGEVGIRSYTGATGSNIFDNLTLFAAIPDPSTYASM